MFPRYRRPLTEPWGYGYWRRCGSRAAVGRGPCPGSGVGDEGAVPARRHTRASGSSAGACNVYPSGQACPSRPSRPFAPSAPGGPDGPAGPGSPCGPGGPAMPSAPGRPGAPAGPGAPVASAPSRPFFPGGPAVPEGPAGPGSPRGPAGPTTPCPGSPRLPGGPATGFPPSCSTWRARASRAPFAVARSSVRAWMLKMIQAKALPTTRAPTTARRSPRLHRRSSARTVDRLTLPLLA